jgi:hypothetical protein
MIEIVRTLIADLDTPGSGLIRACPGPGAMRAARPAMVATAAKKNVKCFIDVLLQYA